MLFAKKKKKRKKLMKKIKGVQVPILILNEIWLENFNKQHRTDKTDKLEEELKEAMKKQARLMEVLKKVHEQKKKNLNIILKLTTEVFENGNEVAKYQMEKLQKEVIEINESIEQIASDLEKVPIEIDNANRALLDETVDICYSEMLESQEQLKEITPKIDKMREELKELVVKQTIYEETYKNTYTLLHHLIGEELIERLDYLYQDEGDK